MSGGEIPWRLESVWGWSEKRVAKSTIMSLIVDSVTKIFWSMVVFWVLYGK